MWDFVFCSAQVSEISPNVPSLSEEEIISRQNALRERNLSQIVANMDTLRKKTNADLHKHLYVTAIHGTYQFICFTLRFQKFLNFLESANVVETIQFMTDRQVGALYVVDTDCNIKGFLTEENIVFSEVVSSMDELQSTNVMEIITPVDEIAIVKQNQSVLEAFQVLQTERIRHLPILA